MENEDKTNEPRSAAETDRYQRDTFSVGRIFIFLSLGLGITATSGIYAKYVPEISFRVLLISGVAISTFSILTLILKYLSTNRVPLTTSFTQYDTTHLSLLKEIQSRLSNQQIELEKILQTLPQETLVRPNVAPNEAQKTNFEKKHNEYSLVHSVYADTANRLNNEITVLGKRANVNLGIGSTISIISLSLLGFFIFKQDFTDLQKVLLQFIPKLSLVVFIEVFSFFFLRLYKTSLAEIKHYQNELSNLQLKQIGLLTSINFGTTDDISVTIKNYSNSERNFILKKGETTVGMEKEKAENNLYKHVVGAISKIGKKD